MSEPQANTLASGSRVDPPSPKVRVRRWLWPKEHGAYAQLLLPLAAALVLTRLRLSGVCLATGALAAFFAHEPGLVLLGHRGLRAKTRDTRTALTQLVSCAVVGFAALAIGLWIDPALQSVLLLPAALAGVALVSVVVRKEKTLLGELNASLALSSASLPVIASTDPDPWRPYAYLIAWGLGFFALTAAGRSVVRRTKSQPWLAEGIVLLAASGAVIAAVIGQLAPYPLEALAAAPYSIPMFAAAWGLIVLKPSPKHLMRIGWSFAASSLLCGLMLVLFW